MRQCSWMLLLALAVGLAGCEFGVSWDSSEKQNARHIFQSLAEARRAAGLANELPRHWEPGGETVEPVLEALDDALMHATQVRNSVLTKAHPQLSVRFRTEYRPALRDLREYFRSGEIDSETDPRETLGEFTEWFYSNQHEFRWWRNHRRDLGLE
ncbi:hypothetical protein VCB98_00755 [Gammaproteobacteria bacterium AB-CW1]|uniref:Lipoprotein n=1 Tax=Natronospira elongata TaxID=3110268 RepID=A0AAP6JCI2_9GAMM|nr:hypothetical protein [Gammaproteobacteria bacterium AB-CW1]